MRQFRTAFAAVLSLIALFSAMLVSSPTRTASAAPAAQRVSACEANPGKEAYPNVLLLGETTTITLTFNAVCAGETNPLHLVFVLDESGSMQGDPINQLKQAVKTIIRGMALPDNPTTKIGIVAFQSTARTLCKLMNDEGRLLSCAGKLTANGGTQIDRGIIEALKVLADGRKGLGDDVEPNEVMIVVSDGQNNTGCDSVKSAARRARGQGVLVITVCVGGGCDAQCMRECASSARYFFEVDNAGQLVNIFDKLRDTVTQVTLRRLTVVDTIPANMELIDDSDDPPAEVSSDKKTLKWEFQSVAKDGVVLTFKLRPLEVGYHPTNTEAVAEFTDNQNKSGQSIFRVPYVTVFQPVQIPAPSEPPPTTTVPPTPTPTNTSFAPTNTPTPTPTNTPTPRPKPIYLPLIISEKCLDTMTYKYADVALVLDISTSMDRPTETGRSKQKAVLEAAKFFMTQLDFTPNQFGQYDQMSIAWFNDNAAIEQPLTNDAASLVRAIDNLPKRRGEGTRLDKAFQIGMQALPDDLRKKGQGRTFPNGTLVPDNMPVVIMLTDGLPNRVPFGAGSSEPQCPNQECTVIKYASQAKDSGITVYTIGVGRPDAPNLVDRVHAELLRECATRPEMSFITPSAEQVEGIYGQIHAEFEDKCYNWPDNFGARGGRR